MGKCRRIYIINLFFLIHLRVQGGSGLLMFPVSLPTLQSPRRQPDKLKLGMAESLGSLGSRV